ncbi:UBAC1-like protein [Mya arenaria]|uniref:UBAC1-like protein n=1 Tax=Mya arenaria TaxID=6604 RepID=A0ABY7G7V6_MYAAR|nr:UBAC1-like protein [Mya arenaria]
MECSRSRTDYFGFLSLERWTACMAFEDSIPPCKIWTNSEVVIKKIIRTAGVHDVVHSSNFVLGRRLLDTLIGDLFEVGKVGSCIRFEEYKKELFRDKPKGLPVNGAVTVKQLVGILSSARRMRVAMAYGSVCELLRKCDIDVESVITDGLVQMELVHFPALDAYDRNRNAIMSWSLRSGLWKIIGGGKDASQFRGSPGVLTMLVVAELERLNIVFVSKLKKLPSSFPWIEQCAKKLQCLKLEDDGIVLVLSFLSCVALLMNGWYVAYANLERLMREMPVNQCRLRDMEIQSKLLLANFNKYKLFRLHHTISFRLPAVDKNVSINAEVDKIDEDKEAADVLEEGEISMISEDVDVMKAEEAELRKILISLIDVSQKLLCLNPEASKIFQQAEEILNEGSPPERVDEDSVRQLTDMGFSASRARKALSVNKMSVMSAMEWLLQHSEDSDIDSPAEDQGESPSTNIRSLQTCPELGAEGGSQVDRVSEDENSTESRVSEGRAHTESGLLEGGAHTESPCKVSNILQSLRAYRKREFKPNQKTLQSLVEMGFEETDCINALRSTRNDGDAACEMLINNKKPAPEEVDEGMDRESPLFRAIMSNPAVQLGLNNPRCLLAFIQMLEHPHTANQWLSDPETAPLLVHISRIYHAEKHSKQQQQHEEMPQRKSEAEETVQQKKKDSNKSSYLYLFKGIKDISVNEVIERVVDAMLER